MRTSSGIVTRSRFQRRVPPGRLDIVFREVFDGYSAAGRYFGVATMTIWRWCHDRTPPPARVLDDLERLAQQRVEQAHNAQELLRQYRYFVPPKPPRPLSGCCAGYFRKPKERWPF